jgi:hypothetical protein
MKSGWSSGKGLPSMSFEDPSLLLMHLRVIRALVDVAYTLQLFRSAFSVLALSM